MNLHSYLLLLLVFLVPLAKADSQTDEAKKVIARELLKALLEDDDDEAKDQQQKAKVSPKKNKATETFTPSTNAVFSFEAHQATPGAVYPSLILATATIKDDGSPDDPTDATHYGDPMATLGVLLRNVQKDDKITVEVPAAKGGVLGKRAKLEGDVVKVDEVLGEISEGEAGVPAGATADGGRQTVDTATPAPVAPAAVPAEVSTVPSCT